MTSTTCLFEKQICDLPGEAVPGQFIKIREQQIFR